MSGRRGAEAERLGEREEKHVLGKCRGNRRAEGGDRGVEGQVKRTEGKR